ncbi:MAG: SDR family oxidoreductase [Aquabacterium sp.]
MNKPRSALITGASTGIGQALALHLDRLGWRVFAGVRRKQDADALRARSSGHLVPVMLDVARPDTIEQARQRVHENTQGHLHALINNAGIAFSGPLETTPPDQVHALFQVNVLGTFAVTQAFLPMLREARGRIVNMSSVSGLFAAPGLTAYAASKFAIEGMTESLRVELAPQHIKVISIAPGKIDTPIWDKARHMNAEISEAMPPAMKAIYGPLLSFYDSYADTEAGTPVGVLTDAVMHALTSQNPDARYVIGHSAKLRTWLNSLPVAWRDGLVLRKMRGARQLA